MRKITLKVPDMHCAACSARVEKVLQGMSGVSKAHVNIATFKGVIEYDESRVNPDQMMDAIREAGFNPEIVPEFTSQVRQVFMVEGMT